MSSEKEFKDNLKEKLNRKEFPFDEANWLEAGKLIDASREEKKRRPFPFFLVSGIVLLVSLLSFYIFKPGETPNGLKLADNTNFSLSQPLTTSENNNGTVKKLSEKKSNKTLSTENNKTVVNTANTDEAVVSNTQENKSVITVSQKNNHTKNVRVRKTSGRKIKNENNSAKSKKADFTNPVKSNVVITKTKKAEHKAPESQSAGNDELQDQDPDVNSVSIKNEDIKNTKPADEILTVTKNTTPLAEVNAGTVAAVPVPAASKADSLKNNIAVEEAKKDSLPKAFVKQPLHFISIEAGATYLTGWKNPGTTDANGFNPVIGLNYATVFSKKILFSIGVYYTTVKNLSYSKYIVTKTHYNFGEESDVIVFTPTTLKYFVAPLRLSYELNSKNSFGMGCNIGYLFNANSTAEFYSQHAGKKEEPTTLKTSGYMQGFKTVNTQLSVFYRRSLMKDLWLNAELMYGLSDVKDNTFFKSNVHERNSGVKVTLIYNLFKK